MLTIASLILVLAGCYFGSRVAIRLPYFAPTRTGLQLAHLSAALAFAALVILVKFWSVGFANVALAKIAGCQAICYIYDHLRGRVPGPASG